MVALSNHKVLVPGLENAMSSLGKLIYCNSVIYFGIRKHLIYWILVIGKKEKDYINNLILKR